MFVGLFLLILDAVRAAIESRISIETLYMITEAFANSCGNAYQWEDVEVGI